MRTKFVLGSIATAALLPLVTTSLAATSASAATVASSASGTKLHPGGLRVRTGSRIAPKAAIKAGAYPASVDLSAYNPPVGDQGQVGSCVTWAEDYGVAGWWANKTGHAGAPYAPMYVYSQIQAYHGWSDLGAYSNEGYDFSNSTAFNNYAGIDTQVDYTQGNYDWWDLPTAAEAANAQANKLGAAHWIFSGAGQGAVVDDAVKAQLAAGHPITIGFPIYQHWDQFTTSDYVYRHADDTVGYRGGHEVMVYGYNSTGLLVQNSWGTSWGNYGRAIIAWDFLENDVYDATYTDGWVAPPTAPAAPTNVTATAGNNSAVVNWTAPNDNGSPIGSYTATASPGGASATVTGNPPSTQATVSGLTNGNSYTFTVTANNGVGTGPASIASNAIIPGGLPGAPTSLLITKNDLTSTATITWAAPTSDGGSQITGYRIARDGTSTTGGGPWTQILSASARTATFQKLVIGSPYNLSVNAINGNGEGPTATGAITVGGSVQESSPSIAYDGWVGQLDASASGGSLRSSSTVGGSVNFTFAGNSVTWLSRKGPSEGIATISVDGVSKGSVDLYAPSTSNFSQTWNSSTTASHKLTIRVSGSKDVASTGSTIVIDGFTVGTTTTQESARTVQYDGWIGSSATGASGGQERANGAGSASAQLAFTGTGIDWITASGPGWGIATVFIDGVSRGTIDLYAPTSHWQTVKSFTGLPSGPHTIRIQPLGTKNARASSAKVVMDAFVVHS